MLVILNNSNFIDTRVNTAPAGKALATTVQALTSSYWIALNDDTEMIRVHAKDQDIYVKWALNGEDYATSSDFDEMVQADTYQDFIVPKKTGEAAENGLKYDGVQLIGRVAGSTAVVIEK